MLLIPRQHAGPVGRAFEPELNRRPSYSQQKKYASSCPTWLPKVLQTNKLSLLERLPNDVQKLIFSNLDYQSLIFLSMVNRHFHRTVDPPRMATLQDKFELVMRAAKDFPQHWASEKKKDQRPGNLECYWCFRVRSPQHFDVLQANTAYFDPQGRFIPEQEAGPQDRLMPLRRFCIGCGVKAGLHAPSDCIVTRTGLDLWTALQLVHCGPKEGGVAVTIRLRDPSIASYCIREFRWEASANERRACIMKTAR
ncbi:f-box domain-containing protein [Fusarium mundagurra]|uniref:F-box domain-containing protein n=1 Tax=Fusarium mundagurra TaxID=1567541 RepID=A0A8H5YCQ7_9HYPO|nr:f-box domain-containing protein [Fusarium mundagurra]